MNIICYHRKRRHSLFTHCYWNCKLLRNMQTNPTCIIANNWIILCYWCCYSKTHPFSKRHFFSKCSFRAFFRLSQNNTLVHWKDSISQTPRWSSSDLFEHFPASSWNSVFQQCENNTTKKKTRILNVSTLLSSKHNVLPTTTTRGSPPGEVSCVRAANLLAQMQSHLAR